MGQSEPMPEELQNLKIAYEQFDIFYGSLTGLSVKDAVKGANLFGRIAECTDIALKSSGMFAAFFEAHRKSQLDAMKGEVNAALNGAKN